MIANASHNLLKAQARVRRLRFVLSALLGAAGLGMAVLAGSATVNAEPTAGKNIPAAEAQKAASSDIERSFVTYQTPTGTRTVRVIPLFKVPEDQQDR